MIQHGLWISGNDTVNQQGLYGQKGVASSQNTPGARSATVGWYDSTQKEFWLFGGFGCGKVNTYNGAK